MFLARPLPGTRTRAIVSLALFTAVQVADASMTAVGVRRFGLGAEGNPLVSFYIQTWGLAAGLMGAKLIAVAAGLVLHALSRHLELALLTVVFVFGAIVPWAWALAF